MNRTLTAIAAVTASIAVAIGLAGCGSSGSPQATTAADGGSPSSVANSGRITQAAQDMLADNPSTPTCNPGGLPNEDEETCQHFWNYLLRWKPATDPARGPLLDVAGAGSMTYVGFEGLLDDEHWWGPNGLQKKNADTGAVEACNSDRDANRCTGAYLDSGKTTNIETLDNGSETKSRVTWALSAGDVDFGREHFMAYNNGGAGGEQYAFCGPRSEAAGSGEWVSCSRTSPDGADINTRQPSGNDEDYASYGWVVEDYPVLVGITNKIAGSALKFDQVPVGDGVEFSATASTAGVATGRGEVVGNSGGSGSANAWLAGFRTRTGDGRVVLTGRLRATDSEDPGWNGGLVNITVEFGQRSTTKVEDGKTVVVPPPKPTCTVRQQTGGAQATCTTSQFVAGERSTPGVLIATLQVKGS